MDHSDKIRRIAVGMSGGVDSGMTAFLLKQRGHTVVGVTMQMWDGSVAMPDERRSGCFGPGEVRDIENARKQAERLGIPHVVIPVHDEYRRDVLDYFRKEYIEGRTPNPCVHCNRRVKFGALLDRALAAGVEFDCFATGHYARVERDESLGRYRLLRGVDRTKDQSYFLCLLTQAQLARVMFPLGRLTKEAVKTLARETGWGDAVERPESQDFVESDDYGVLFKEGDAKPGAIVDLKGKKLGEHRGIIHYTVGQRKGLGIGGSREPLYVVRIDPATDTVVVGAYQDLFSREFRTKDVNWIALAGPPAEPARIQAKIRQQHREADATMAAEAGADGGAVRVVFDEPQMSITPGQTAVFYQGDRVLGGGTIVG